MAPSWRSTIACTRVRAGTITPTVAVGDTTWALFPQPWSAEVGGDVHLSSGSQLVLQGVVSGAVEGPGIRLEHLGPLLGPAVDDLGDHGGRHAVGRVLNGLRQAQHLRHALVLAELQRTPAVVVVNGGRSIRKQPRL